MIDTVKVKNVMERVFNWTKQWQIINVDKASENYYLKNWFVRVSDAELKKKQAKEAKAKEEKVKAKEEKVKQEKEQKVKWNQKKLDAKYEWKKVKDPLPSLDEDNIDDLADELE